MILVRMGNKRKFIHKIYGYFPAHRMRIDLFFGAGGAFFSLPKPKYSIVNDLDDDVTNLFLVVQNQLEQLKNMVRVMPVSETLIKYWKKNYETDPVKKAARFLFLSNFTYLGKGDTLRVGLDNAKKTLLANLDSTFESLQDVKILNRDFRDVLNCISFTKGLNDRENCFVYLDPVYLDTEYNYKVPKWTKRDTLDCLDLMVSCGIKAAMSEFDHAEVVDEAKKRGLNIIYIGERANIKKRSVEILITNYQVAQTTLILN